VRVSLVRVSLEHVSRERVSLVHAAEQPAVESHDVFWVLRGCLALAVQSASLHLSQALAKAQEWEESCVFVAWAA
jgi:hypothetical protein